MRSKIVSPAQAAAIVRDGDTLAVSGFGGSGAPVEMMLALEGRFLDTGAPKGLTLLFGASPGDAREGGANRLAHEGLVRRVVAGHYGLMPKIGKLVMEGKVEGYNLPLGVVSHMYRDIACGLPGTLSKVGLGTFVDPRFEGGKCNARTTEDLVEVVRLGGEELLFYKTMPISVAFIRGTTADPEGNMTMERESLTQDMLAIAMAAKNSGGFVIAQVERIAEYGSLNPRQVKVPGILVDCVVVGKPENHPQTFGSSYDPGFSAEIRTPLDALEPMALDERKIIARRAAFELMPNAVVNLGIGVPEGVASVAAEEKILRYMTLTAEPGLIGGVPAGGLDFGAAVNSDSVIDMNQQFDLYDGGGLDLACLGLAQCDEEGNINVSRFGPRLAGAGGFIDIAQNSGIVVFAGTFTAGGLQVDVEDGELRIKTEGRAKKFVKKVEQVTFGGRYAASRGQKILYVTERCVFRLTAQGLELVEVAPGIDVERDILAQMDFEPIVQGPVRMDPRIFLPEPMRLKDNLLSLAMVDRVVYDARKESLFCNFQGLALRTGKDVDELAEACESIVKPIGKKVAVVINYDGFTIEEGIIDHYTDRVVKYFGERYFTTVARYTTSAFLRVKLGDALKERGLSPRIYETHREAIDASRPWTDGAASAAAPRESKSPP
jgi:propionate CoA-transferase